MIARMSADPASLRCLVLLRARPLCEFRFEMQVGVGGAVELKVHGVQWIGSLQGVRGTLKWLEQVTSFETSTQ